MYLSETLARDRHEDTIDQARHARRARRVAELNRLQRRQLRAERRMLTAWERTDELRSMLEASL
ncbi:MAG TPA: hypothetical protein VG164_03530 [Trebonia sp.]|nr:hypothetical protein [Trebonia sp.]